MAAERFLITGARGCIGTWTVRRLLDEGCEVVATDLGDDSSRVRLLLSDAEMGAVDWQRLDVTDTEAVRAMVADKRINRIIHLAGLQVPFSRANPPLGAAVNVVGTVNILEAARHAGVAGLAYASSLAVLGPSDLYPQGPLADDAARIPNTLYGVYKVANEETARIYWQDWQVGSIGLRPYTVFGVARDQGMTADIAKAILAAAAGRPFHIRFSGPLALQHANDVAGAFIAAARAEHRGAAVCNLRGDVTTVEAFVAALLAQVPEAKITVEADSPLPFPADLSDAGLRAIVGEVPHTPLAEAIARDLAAFRALIAADAVDLTQLET